MFRPSITVLGLVLVSSCTAFPPPEQTSTSAVSSATGAPQILVTARGGGPLGLGTDAMLPLPLPPCTETGGPVEITVSLDDADGLSSARISFSGPVRSGSLRATPEGPDVTVGRRGAADEEIIEFGVADGALRRTSAVISFTTAAPHSGELRATATDRTGASSQTGVFRLTSDDCGADVPS